MSAVAPSSGDDQPVVGEPVSHPHQAVVVGEPPENSAPVLGEPAFPNGLQDQQPISSSAVDMTAANGVQPTLHTPLHEGSSASSSHVSAPSSAPPVEESPNAQQVTTTIVASDPRVGEGASHQSEAPVAEDSIASRDEETAVAPNTHDAVSTVQEARGADTPEVVEVTHIEDNSSEPHLPPIEAASENPFVALVEGVESDENVSNASLTAEEISSKGLVDEQREAPLLSSVQEKQSTEHPVSAQTDTDNRPVEGNKAVNDDEKDANETSTTESVQENKTETVQANDRMVDIPKEPEVTSREMQHGLSEAVSEPEVSSAKPSTPPKDVDALPFNPDLKNHKGASVDAHLMDSSATPPGTRGIAVEECVVNQSPANGDNGFQDNGDGDRSSEREQDLRKDEVGESTVSDKSNSRIKLPLIFTGVAIAVVGVAFATLSRPR